MNELQLVVTKNIAGELETNIGALEKFVTERLKSYEPEKYSGDADSAKKDRAELNNAKKMISQSRISLMNELMKPYADFENRCKALEKNIESASGKLDLIVKAREAEEKEKKRGLILEMWNEKNFNLFPIDKVFSQKWLNKTTRLNEVENEIDSIIARTYSDLKTIEKFSDDAELIKARYLEDLNIGNALDWAEEMQKNRARVEAEKAERAEREHAEKLQEQRADIETESRDFQKKSAMGSLIADALEVEIKPEKKEFVISFSGTESQFIAVKNFLTAQGIEINSAEELKF